MKDGMSESGEVYRYVAPEPLSLLLESIGL